MNNNFVPLNPQYKETILNELHHQEFMKHIDCQLVTIEPGYVVAEIRLQMFHKQQVGIIHGGVIATIADVAAGFAGFTLIEHGDQLVTVELKTSYFRPTKGLVLKAFGRVVKQGNTLHFCEADIYSYDSESRETHVARASATMAIIKKGTV